MSCLMFDDEAVAGLMPDGEWTKVSYSSPRSLTQGQFTEVTLSAKPNLANYKEAMLVLCEHYTPGNNDTIEATTVFPIGTVQSVLASYAYPTGEGYYTRAMLQFGGDKTTISKAYIQDGGNHTSNTFYVEIYAR